MYRWYFFNPSVALIRSSNGSVVLKLLSALSSVGGSGLWADLVGRNEGV